MPLATELWSAVKIKSNDQIRGNDMLNINPVENNKGKAMDQSTNTNDPLRLLVGLENGTLSMTDAYDLAESCDPVVVFLFLNICARNITRRTRCRRGSSAGLST